MKKIFILSALVLGLSFPITSQAEVSVFGVTVPVTNESVSDNLRGGYVARSLSDTFVVQKLHKRTLPPQYENEEDTYIVFGVRVPVNPSI